MEYSQMKNLCKLHTHEWWDTVTVSVYLSSLQNHVSGDLFSLATTYTDMPNVAVAEKLSAVIQSPLLLRPQTAYYTGPWW